jgi:hypothetical protein
MVPHLVMTWLTPPMKPSICDLCNGKSVIVESCNDEVFKENHMLRSENKNLKQQVLDIKFGYKTLTNGRRLHDAVITRAINFAKNGLGVPSPKLVEASKNR